MHPRIDAFRGPALLALGLSLALAGVPAVSADPTTTRQTGGENTETPLTLEEAEQRAVERDPASARYRAEAAAAAEAAVSAGALPDPELTAGAMNLPTDSFSVADDPMAQIQLGLRQGFPTGRDAARQGSEAQAAAARAQAQEATRTARREARQAFLELYYRTEAVRLLKANRDPFQAMVDAAERELGAGRADRQDLLQATLARERLEDRIDDERIAVDEARARLARWVGQEMAHRPLAPSDPDLPAVPTRDEGREHLRDHPRLVRAAAEVGAGQAGVAEAEAAYRPDWGVEVTYGHRRADGMDGDTAPDTLSAMVMVELPLFTANRQDRDRAAGKRRLDAAQAQRREAELELQRALEATYDRWQRLETRSERYQQRLVRLATDSAEAALAAYRADTVEFTALQQARTEALEVRLEALRLENRRAQAQAELLELLGEDPS